MEGKDNMDAELKQSNTHLGRLHMITTFKAERQRHGEFFIVAVARIKFICGDKNALTPFVKVLQISH